MNVDLLEKIEATSGLKAKEALVRTASGKTYELLRLVMDPYVTFGVQVPANLEKLTPERPRCSTFATEAQRKHHRETFARELFALLDRLRTRDLSGGAASAALTELLDTAPDALTVKWAVRVVNKDLRLGVAIKTWLSAFPRSVVPFEVQLAEDGSDCEKWPWDVARDGAAVEPKYDGLRMIAFGGADEPLPRALTRNGKEVFGIEHVLAALRKLPGRFVLDGEGFGDTFEDSLSAARTQVRRESNLKFYVFDHLTAEEWTSRTTLPDAARRQRLEALLRGQEGGPLVLVPRRMTKDPGSLVRTAQEFEAAGFEGAVVKNPKAPYRFKRSTDWSKIKFMKTGDYTVVGVEEGTGRNVGKLGALVVRVGEATNRVGSGFTDEQRVSLWADRERLPGRVAEVQYQNATPDGKLRFPVFVRMRPDKE